MSISLSHTRVNNMCMYVLFQKSKNGDPLSLLKKQLEDKERTLQEGKKNIIFLLYFAPACHIYQFLAKLAQRRDVLFYYSDPGH